MKILLFANTDWYLYNFRLPLARMLREHGADVILLSPPGEYVRKLEAEGFRWLGITMSAGGMNPFEELRTVFRVRRSYRTEKPDLVHHFTPKCLLYGSLAARWSRIGAVVNSVTGLGYLLSGDGWRGRLTRRLAWEFYRLAFRGTQVIFQNPEDLRLFVAKGIVPSAATELIPSSGVDPAGFAVLPEPSGPPVVMLAARMLWDKGVGDFVEAARRVRAGDGSTRFVLVGDTYPGNPSAVPADQLAEWQREGLVEWWGWHDDMPATLAQANVVCLPTYYGEGVPRVLVEAAACGRAVIASDIAGCREVVRPDHNGLLVPPRDPAALADAIRALLAGADLRHRMGANGRRLVEDFFSAEKVNQATLKVYARAGQVGLA
jgi:glycosyltransferase involved in cell wall biosynthesis